MLWTAHSTIAAVLAQVPTPGIPTPTVAPTDVDLLQRQVEFLEGANARLANDFSRYVSTLNITIGLVGLVLTIITLVGAVLFGKSLADFYRTLRTVNQEVERVVRQKVEQEVGLVVRNRVDRLEALLARENLLKQITVAYILPMAPQGARSENLDFSIKVLEQRGFKVLPYFIPVTKLGAQMISGDVIVLDLFNAGTEESQASTVIEQVAKSASNLKTPIVIYVVGFQSPALNQLSAAGRYCIGANSPLSFAGRVVEAAYIADAIRS